MYPLSPFFCLVVFVIAYTTAFVLQKIFKSTVAIRRYETIDGLRGFLAIGVFIHHAVIWHQYIHTGGTWDLPASGLYVHLGQTSVAFFFMITSFLFVNKILHTKNNFDFKQFFIGRLTPLYFISVGFTFFIVMVISNWRLQVSLFDFINSIAAFATFTIFGNPLINNATFSPYINAGVYWSLQYEWLFYCSLPLIYMAMKKKFTKPIFVLLALAFSIFFFVRNGFLSYHIFSFVGGGVAAYLLQYKYLYEKIKPMYWSIIILLCLPIIVNYHSAHKIFCVGFISIVFTIVAQGNSIFGLLQNSTLKFLGEICYSTYLLHGIILFISIYFAVGVDKVSKFSLVQYCYLIFAITPFVIVISYFAYTFIEKPFINIGKYFLNNDNLLSAK
jgi:peptidoglycan/LPS O-acetylase OafA/YrhL